MTGRWFLAFALLLFGRTVDACAQRTYGGPGSCSSSGCHGSIWPKTGGRIGQNEYQTWATKDRHAKAYSVLLEPRSKLIAKNLKIEKPETSSTCLDCHSTNVPVAERATTFDLSDGVGCESCHGASSGWIQPHTTRNWTHDQSVKAGMTDLLDVKQRVNVCLSCHLGTKDKTVGHELIAAGHPDLIFEMETFSALMPVHWQPANEKSNAVQRWAVSQTIALRNSVEQMGTRNDFADFECSSCHHNLVTPSPRQMRGFAGRPGQPLWNESRYIVARRLIGAIAPATLTELDNRIEELKKGPASPDTIKRLVDVMNTTIPAVEKTTFDASLTTKILRSIAADANEIGWAGLASAEQATMSIDVLYNATHPGKRDDAVNVQIDGLYKMLQSKSGYEPEQFANALRKIAPLL